MFGIANFARAGRAPLDVDAIAARDPRRPRATVQPATFRVSARRADKRFPLTSPQIEREVGGRIKEARGWRVDLDEPELTIHVEALTNEAFYFFGKERGAGGLPVGSSGRVACLLSGGIDSPVAAWRMMRRGCRVLFVHFHSYPILSRASQEKARELARLLTRFQFDSRLFLVPFGEIQQQVVLDRPAAAARRRLSPADDADRRAHRAAASRAGARHRRSGRARSRRRRSRTWRRSAAVATLPVLRPLIGMDKEEITVGGAAARHLSGLDHSGSGLLHAVHAASSGDARAAVGRRSRRRGARHRRDRPARGRRGRPRALHVPMRSAQQDARRSLPADIQ